MKTIKYEEFNIDDVKFDIVKIKKGRQNHYVNRLPATFDIETSEVNDLPFMYSWQFFISGITILGNTWTQFNDLLTKLSNKLGKNELIIAVHNLDFEFSFMNSYVKFDDVFRNSYMPDKIFYCVKDNLRFIDTAKISAMTLEDFTKNCIHEKVKDFDYDKVRFADTKLTKDEIKYIVNDVVGLAEATENLMKNENLDILHLPITNAGFAKDIAKNYFKKHPWNVPEIEEECLRLGMRAARGGNVWVPILYRGELLRKINSDDSNSMYPSVMVSEKYPIGRPIKVVGNENILYHLNNGYAGLFNITFKHIRLKDENEPNPYIVYRREKGDKITGETLDGDRVLKTEENGMLNVTLTDVDLQIINNMYDYDDIIIHEAWFSKYGYLPSEFRFLIIDMWKTKENAEGYEREKAKRFINTLYGAMLQNPLYPRLKLDDNGEPVKDEKGHYIKEEIKFQRKYNVWYNYLWGVWTAAWGRYRLQKAIDLCGDKLVYCDTDAVKYPIGEVDLSELNAEIIEKNKKAGVPKEMGLFRSEYTCKRFVALGAKQWCGENLTKVKKDGTVEVKKLEITCSGLKTAKTEAVDELKAAGGIKAFKDGFTFHKTGLGPVKVIHPKETIEYEGHTIELGNGRLIRPRPPYELKLGDQVLDPEEVEQAMQDLALEEQ